MRIPLMRQTFHVSARHLDTFISNNLLPKLESVFSENNSRHWSYSVQLQDHLRYFCLDMITTCINVMLLFMHACFFSLFFFICINTFLVLLWGHTRWEELMSCGNLRRHIFGASLDPSNQGLWGFMRIYEDFKTFHSDMTSKNQHQEL